MGKKRLDIILLERALVGSIQEAQAHILAGEVWSKQTRLEKAGETFKEDFEIEIRSRSPKFISRAGHKLEHALTLFQVDPKDRVCMDVGASTGGFTHCLLQKGAKHVFAVDVGYGLLDVNLRNDARVSNLEKTNAKTLTMAQLNSAQPFADALSLIAVDVSFISLRAVLEPISKEFKQCRDYLLLFKPQFEVDKKHVKKGGFVDDSGVVATALQDFDAWIQVLGFKAKFPPSPSPLPGKKSGNVEYLLLYEKEAT